ncbi:MAG: hypothetical protein KY464_10925, partial [Gemmatimonadetes bacterium]|nr:hypothetical protein [Gemmatimonadota bacterium]
AAVPVLQAETHLPVIVDPSHAGGRAALVGPLARAAVAVGADGLILEVHPEPCTALSDGDPSRDFDAFEGVMRPLAPVAAAVRIRQGPRIDGSLDDAVWAQAPVINSFTQRDPVEGSPVSEATEARIVYDDQAIYVGARLHDRSGVTARLGRRDMPLASSDWFRVSFDSYHDRRTASRFDVNPAGVRRDATLGGGGGLFGGGAGIGGLEGDLAWDAVWDAEATIDEGGWTVEMRIPFSQLRFASVDEQVWGIQLERIINRTQELALFSFTRKSEPGGVPAFGNLTGLRGIRPGRPLELIPYVLSQGNFARTGSNPFLSDREYDAKAGLDARYRITSNLTLSATVNPDFGQVEVDPAIINLSAFETRLLEKRPFFVEGASSFRFGGNVEGPGGSPATLLYSRRLGRAPQVGIRAAQSSIPGTTGILGAAKLSGKTASGWSLGILEAVTDEELGLFIDGTGTRQHAIVEPRSNYFVARLARELRRGQSSVGGILTAVNRDLADGGAAAVLRSGAYTGGVDFSHDWANRSWAVGGFLVGSQSRGSASSVLLAQRSSLRYYQRPDAESFEVDPTATSMGGFAGTIQLRKPSGRHWTGDVWIGTISPGFEINDLGFLQRSDRTGTGGMLRYSERQPGRLFRRWSAAVSQNFAQNYDGDFIEMVVRGGGSATLLNYWELNLNNTFELERLDDRLTRGGPLAIKPASWTSRAGIESDPRNPIIAGVDLGLGRDAEGNTSRSIQGTVDLRTSPRWNLSISPRYQSVHQDAQYVSSVTDAAMNATYGARYVFAPLDQTEISLVTRVNYTFSPDLTFELYAQPLVSHGEYGTPKQLQRPSSYEFAEFGSEVGSLARTGNRWTIDPDAGGPLRSFTSRTGASRPALCAETPCFGGSTARAAPSTSSGSSLVSTTISSTTSRPAAPSALSSTPRRTTYWC